MLNPCSDHRPARAARHRVRVKGREPVVTTQRLAVRIRHTTAITLVAVLVACTPAFAEPSIAATSTPSKTTTKTATPKPKPPTPKAPVRKPPETGSAIDVGVNEKTEAFRKELAEKQKRLDEFTAQLDALDRELEIASEDYNAAVDRLSQMKSQVQVAQLDLDNARAAYALQNGILGERANSMYRDGSIAGFEVLLDSKSVSDFVARMKFLNTIGLADADIADSLRSQKEAMEKQVVDLRNTETMAESLEFELKARQIEVMLRIQERQSMLAAAQKDLLQMLDQEAGRRSGEESALLADALSGASKAGIVVEPGSPVETALAYHGIPYLWGGETPSGFDCSGLILYVYKQHGVKLPHYSGSQFQLGEKISPAALQPGDAVFFGSPIHHVGMYIGGGYYLHAPRTGDFVKISKLSGRRDYAGGRRYPWKYRVAPPLGAKSSISDALRGTP